MEVYEQPVYISYAKNIERVKLKHKVNKKVFIDGILNTVIFVLFALSVFNVIQILF